MYVASVTMLAYVCRVRSMSMYRTPSGAYRNVRRPARFSLQPGGMSIVKPAVVAVSDGGTRTGIQPAGTALDGLSSACTVFGRFALPVVCALAPEVGWPRSAYAAPPPMAAAATRAAAISAIMRPRG